MKNKSRRFLAGILAGIIGVQLLGGAVVESRAEAEAKVEVQVTGQEGPVIGAAVEAALKEGSITLTGQSQDGRYQAGTVSANAVSGSYEVTVAADGYETSTQAVEFTAAEFTLSGTVDISPYRLYEVTGQVVDKQGRPLAGVTVQTAEKTVSTNEQGDSTLLLTAGTYTLSLQKEGYQMVTKGITVSQEPCSVSANALPKAYALQIPVENEAHGSITVTAGGRSAEPVSGTYTCYEGEDVTIQAEPEAGYRLTPACMLRMEPEKEGGDRYFYKIDALDEESAAKDYPVQFEEARYAWIYYECPAQQETGSIIRISHAPGGKIEKTSAVSFQAKADTAGKYYIKDVTGPVEKTGADHTFTFQKTGRLRYTIKRIPPLRR